MLKYQRKDSKMIPSPNQIAARSELLRNRESLEKIDLCLRESFPSVLWAAEQAGVDTTESLKSWIKIAGATSVADWVDSGTSGAQLALRLKDGSFTDKSPLLGRLIQEAQLSSRAAHIAPYLRMHGLSLETCILRARNNVAGAAFEAAFDVTSARRTVFARTLRLARDYLEFIHEADELAGEDRNSFLAMRLATTAVLTARFAPVKETELQNACTTLLNAYDGTNDFVLAPFLEGCLWLYDGFDLRESLERGARTIRHCDSSVPPSNVSWILNSAAIWSKLAGCAVTKIAQDRFLDLALETLHRLDAESIPLLNDRLAFEMQDAYLTALRERSSDSRRELGCKGVQFPFALRTSHTELPSEFYDVGEEIAERIRSSNSAGSYLYRDVLAEMLSYVARDVRTPKARAIELLEEAVDLRRGVGGQKQLMWNRSRLAQAEDNLFLARLTLRSEVRMRALLYLASDTEADADSATRLSVLAKEIETNGPYVAALLPVDDDLAIAIRNGNSRGLYERAARAATRSHDLTRIALGGRGSVIALHDTGTQIGQTFVYKLSKKIALERDRAATRIITQAITVEALSNDFGVIELLSTMPPSAAGIDDPSQEGVVSVRRFRNGRTLQRVIATGEADTRAIVGRTTTFLALIQSNLNAAGATTGVRRTIRETEMGWWLRAVAKGQERSRLFNQWWSTVDNAPKLPRRDAHALNWLVEGEAKIVAVDLESIGSRPFGYELAQLLEDTTIFPIDDWESRAAFVKAYIKELHRFGTKLTMSETASLEFYAAGVLARAMRMLSRSELDREAGAHGGALLDSVARRFTGSAVGELAMRLAHLWAERTGVASDQELMPLADAERRRISRAMSYQLRHNEKAPVTKSGWIYAEDLAQLLISNGHKVTAQQLLSIAGALGEPRFELDVDEIRSSYGHSTSKIAVNYEPRRPPEVLFHATPLRNLRSILEAQDGIRKGQRQWVHMTDSVEVALSASRRQGQPVVVLAIDTKFVDDVVYAKGHTWLAKRVSNSALRILTVREMTELLSATPNVGPSS